MLVTVEIHNILVKYFELILISTMKLFTESKTSSGLRGGA